MSAYTVATTLAALSSEAVALAIPSPENLDLYYAPGILGTGSPHWDDPHSFLFESHEETDLIALHPDHGYDVLLAPRAVVIAFVALQNRVCALYAAHLENDAGSNADVDMGDDVDALDELKHTLTLNAHVLSWLRAGQPHMPSDSLHDGLAMWWALAHMDVPLTRATVVDEDSRRASWPSRMQDPAEFFWHDWADPITHSLATDATTVSPATNTTGKLTSEKAAFSAPFNEFLSWTNDSYYARQYVDVGRRLIKDYIQLADTVELARPLAQKMRIGNLTLSAATGRHLLKRDEYFNKDLMDAYLHQLHAFAKEREKGPMRGIQWRVDDTGAPRLKGQSNLPESSYATVVDVGDMDYAAVIVEREVGSDEELVITFADIEEPLNEIPALVSKTLSKIMKGRKAVPATAVECRRDFMHPPRLLMHDASSIWALQRVRAAVLNQAFQMRRTRVQAAKWTMVMELITGQFILDQETDTKSAGSKASSFV